MNISFIINQYIISQNKIGYTVHTRGIQSKYMYQQKLNAVKNFYKFERNCLKHAKLNFKCTCNSHSNIICQNSAFKE